MKNVLVVGVACAAAVVGCAKSSDEVTATYVSPNQYGSYSCPQLSEEASRISSRASIAAGTQDQKRSNDSVATGVAIIVFWPAAFLVGGNDQNTAELARLRGEMEAIEQASVLKRCGIQFRRSAPSASQEPPPRG